jgi:hypothetical protein
VNPKGPHDGQRIQTTPVGFGVPVTVSWDKILSDLRILAARDNASAAYVYREALIEYHQRHFPGNPGLPLTHWITGDPLSVAAQEKLLIPCQTKTCEFCHGTGKHPTDPYGLRCDACGGHGNIIIGRGET